MHQHKHKYTNDINHLPTTKFKSLISLCFYNSLAAIFWIFLFSPEGFDTLFIWPMFRICCISSQNPGLNKGAFFFMYSTVVTKFENDHNPVLRIVTVGSPERQKDCWSLRDDGRTSKNELLKQHRSDHMHMKHMKKKDHRGEGWFKRYCLDGDMWVDQVMHTMVSILISYNMNYRFKAAYLHTSAITVTQTKHIWWW